MDTLNKIKITSWEQLTEGNEYVVYYPIFAPVYTDNPDNYIWVYNGVDDEEIGEFILVSDNGSPPSHSNVTQLASLSLLEVIPVYSDDKLIYGRESTYADLANQSHYTQSDIQPIDLIESLDLNFCEGNVVKYVCRHRYKNGLEDLKKAKVYLNWLIEKAETGTITHP